jgi:hypothetical protein
VGGSLSLLCVVSASAVVTDSTLNVLGSNFVLVSFRQDTVRCSGSNDHHDFLTSLCLVYQSYAM